MAPSLLSLTIIALFSTLALSHDIKHGHITTGTRLKTLKFSFYLHETFNKTAYFVVKGVAGATGITKTSNPFGSLLVFHDPLTETPDPTSKALGYFEGMLVTTSFEGDGTICVSKLTFNLKGYKGELINVGSAYFNRVSELPLVGGTGDFWFAQGYMITSVVHLSGPATCYKIDFTVYWPPYAALAH